MRRTFILHAHGAKLPTDLLGLTCVRYGELTSAAEMRVVNQKRERVVFILWGAAARRKRSLIDTSCHVIIESAHPSPLSASNGFFGSRPFSRTNAALVEAGREPIDWRIPDE